MKEFIEVLEVLLRNIVTIGSIVLELVGILVMLAAGAYFRLGLKKYESAGN